MSPGALTGRLNGPDDRKENMFKVGINVKAGDGGGGGGVWMNKR